MTFVSDPWPRGRPRITANAFAVGQVLNALAGMTCVAAIMLGGARLLRQVAMDLHASLIFSVEGGFNFVRRSAFRLVFGSAL